MSLSHSINARWRHLANKPSDAIEFRPWQDGDTRSVMACGTYELDEKRPDHRHGGFHIFTYFEDDANEVENQWVEGPACFDLSWSPDGQYLYQACVDGSIQIMNFNDDKANANVAVTADAMITSVDQHRGTISFATSNGNIGLIDAASLTIERIWNGHEQYEVWVSALDRHSSIMYSGSDDCLFKAWDSRQTTTAPIFKCEIHTMGVTSIQSHPSRPFIVATGSYDENVRIWDTRFMKEPQGIHCTGGGVWRLKWHPNSDVHLVLCANMYNGFSVIDVQNFHSIHDFAFLGGTEKSIAYGADWCRDPAHPYVLATCSFYDRDIRLSRLEKK